MVSLFSGDAKLPFTGRQVCLERDGANRLLDLDGWRKLATVIREFKPDVIQANAGDTLKYAVFSQAVFGWETPLIFRNANKVSDFLNSTLKKWFNQLLVRRVKHVISVSELCRRDFVSTYSFPKSRISMVPIGVEAVDDAVRPVPQDLAAAFQNRTVLVHVASFVPEKNHLGLLRIVEQLVSKIDNVLCLLVGDGKLRPSIEAAIRERKLQDHVSLLGYRADVLSLMTHARAVVLPSLIEGLPAVILEAMQCGTPVIAYDVGGISEIVRPGETGWLVRAGDERSFALAIEEALKETNREKVTRRAREMTIREFNNADIADRFIAIFHHMGQQQKQQR